MAAPVPSAWGERPWGDGIGMALRRGDGSRLAHAPVRELTDQELRELGYE